MEAGWPHGHPGDSTVQIFIVKTQTYSFTEQELLTASWRGLGDTNLANFLLRELNWPNPLVEGGIELNPHYGKVAVW